MPRKPLGSAERRQRKRQREAARRSGLTADQRQQESDRKKRIRHEAADAQQTRAAQKSSLRAKAADSCEQQCAQEQAGPSDRGQEPGTSAAATHAAKAAPATASPRKPSKRARQREERRAASTPKARDRRLQREALWHQQKQIMKNGSWKMPRAPGTAQTMIPGDDAAFEELLRSVGAEDSSGFDIPDDVSDGEDVQLCVFPDAVDEGGIHDAGEGAGPAQGDIASESGTAASASRPHKRRRKRPPPARPGDSLSPAQRRSARARGKFRPGPSMVMERLRRGSPVRVPLPRSHPPMAWARSCGIRRKVAGTSRPRSAPAPTARDPAATPPNRGEPCCAPSSAPCSAPYTCYASCHENPGAPCRLWSPGNPQVPVSGPLSVSESACRHKRTRSQDPGGSECLRRFTAVALFLCWSRPAVSLSWLPHAAVPATTATA